MSVVEPPRRVSFPRGAWIALTAFGLVLLASLLVQVKLIRDQRQITRDQRALAARQLRILGPLVEETRPLVKRVRHNLPRAGAMARRADRLVRTATPLVAALPPAQVAHAARSTAALADALLEADAGANLQEVGRLAGDLLRNHRLDRLLRDATYAPRLYRVQVRAYRLQTQQLELARQTLAVATLAEQHAASLDRKLLGSNLP